MNKRGVLFLTLCSCILQLYAGPGTGFIENKNQWPCEVDFLADIQGGQMAISAGQFNYFFLDYGKVRQLHEASHSEFNEADPSAEVDHPITGRKVSVSFINSNSFVRPKAFGRSNIYYNYFFGSDPAKWGSKAYQYQEIVYQNIYNGIDLRITTEGNNIKYDLIVDPAVDPATVQLKYEGARQVYLSNGDLIIDAALAEIIEKKPIAYQIIDGKKKWVSVAYLLADEIVSFSFPEGYDPCVELVIDPLLIFATYSGSQADNWGSTATPGEKGYLYSSGVTNHFVGQAFSGTFLATPGAFQTTYGGLYDVAILKYDSIGQNLLYASYLGGSQSESPHSLVMDKDENLLVFGTTSSNNFPVTAGAYDETYNNVGNDTVTHVVSYFKGSDIFVSKISKDGSQLLASTFLGGSKQDGVIASASVLVQNYGDQLRGDIISDENGDIFLSTVTASNTDFPVINSFGTTYNGGGTDAVVVKLNANLSQVLWSAYVGGAGSDAAYSIKFDSNGKLFLAGGTTSANFPVSMDANQSVFAGTVDGWIAKLEPDGSGIIAATYTGTTAYDQIYFLDLNSNDEVYVYGQTAGPIPVSLDVYSNPNSGQFLQKFDNNLKNLLLSTVFGRGTGKPDISPTAFLVNDCNNIYMTGWGGLVNVNVSKPLLNSSSTNGLPVTPDAYQKTTLGSDFYFIVLTDDATQFLYGTYLGGTQSLTHVDGGTSRFDKSGIVYHAVCSGCNVNNASGMSSSDFPTTPNAWSATNNSLNCNNAAFKFDLSSLNARIITNTLALDHPGIADVCLPDKLVFQNRSTGGQFYEWDFGDGTTETKPDTAAIIHEYKLMGTYQVKLRAVDQGTCIGEDFDFATVRVHQASGFAGDDVAICEGSSIQLEAGGGTAYEWRTKSEGVVSDLARPLLTPEDTTTYFVSITDSNGCVVKDTVEVDVVPRIDLRFDYQKISDCYSRAALQVTNKSSEEFEQFFDLGDGNNSTQRELTYNYENDGVYSVKLVGKRDFCTFEEIVTLPFVTIKVPNVLTPGNTDANSSGKNDTFKIRYGPADNSPTTTEAGVKVALSVYNRWGKIVYQNNDYKAEWEGGGLEAGTYYYEVEIENEPLCKGWVQLIR